NRSPRRAVLLFVGRSPDCNASTHRASVAKPFGSTQWPARICQSIDTPRPDCNKRRRCQVPKQRLEQEAGRPLAAPPFDGRSIPTHEALQRMWDRTQQLPKEWIALVRVRRRHKAVELTARLGQRSIEACNWSNVRLCLKTLLGPCLRLKRPCGVA